MTANLSSIDATLEYQYVSGQARPGFAALFDAFRSECALAEALDGWRKDVPYGARPRMTMDVRRASGPRRAAVIYLHAGYWQSRDKSTFRFIAPPLNDAGFDVALANYPLCPDVPFAQIVDAARAIPAAVRAVLGISRGSTPLIVIGHSAGAQLAVEMALHDRAAAAHGPSVSGVLGISGVYDLAPLVRTSLNAKLRLDDDSAQRYSPVHRLVGPLPPATFVVGAGETMAFQRQTEAMAIAWRRLAACRSAALVGEDHFSVLQSLLDPASVLRALLLELAS